MSQAGCMLVTLGGERLWNTGRSALLLFRSGGSDRNGFRPAGIRNKQQGFPSLENHDHPQPAAAPQPKRMTDTAYALVVTENGQWRFERFLTAQESAQFEKEPAK
jgi:hypothetical protein